MNNETLFAYILTVTQSTWHNFPAEFPHRFSFKWWNFYPENTRVAESTSCKILIAFPPLKISPLNRTHFALLCFTHFAKCAKKISLIPVFSVVTQLAWCPEKNYCIQLKLWGQLLKRQKVSQEKGNSPPYCWSGSMKHHLLCCLSKVCTLHFHLCDCYKAFPMKQQQFPHPNRSHHLPRESS